MIRTRRLRHFAHTTALERSISGSRWRCDSSRSRNKYSQASQRRQSTEERTDTPRTNAAALRTQDVADQHVPLVIAEIPSCSSATPVCASHFETPPDRIVRVLDGIATITDSRLCRHPPSDYRSRNGSDRSSCSLKTT